MTSNNPASIYTLFGNLPCCDPETLYREQQYHKLDSSEWFGKANLFSCPLGPEPGIGHVLILRKQLNQLNFDQLYPLEFGTIADVIHFNVIQNTLFPSLQPVKAIALTVGMQAEIHDDLDENTIYLLEFADRRINVKNIPCDIQINIPAPDTSIYPIEYYQNSLDTDENDNPIPYTWQSAIGALWDINGKLGEYPGLPYDPVGIPEGYQFLGVSSWYALNTLLAKIHCAIAYDPIDDTFDIVQLGADDKKFLQAEENNFDALMVNKQPLNSQRVKVQSKVRVYFNKRHIHYGLENTPQASNNQWITDSFYSVDVEITDAQDIPEDFDVETLEPNSTQVFWDDLTALVNEDNEITNSDLLKSRAADIANAYYLSAIQGSDREYKLYDGFISDFRPGSLVKLVSWYNIGSGAFTEVARSVGFIKIPSDATNRYIDQYALLKTSENLLPPDFSRHTYPNYFPQIQVINIISGEPISYTENSTAINVYDGQVEFINPNTLTFSEYTKCWAYHLPDNGENLNSNSKYLGKVFGLIEINNETRPFYVILCCPIGPNDIPITTIISILEQIFNNPPITIINILQQILIQIITTTTILQELILTIIQNNINIIIELLINNQFFITTIINKILQEITITNVTNVTKNLFPILKPKQGIPALKKFSQPGLPKFISKRIKLPEVTQVPRQPLRAIINQPQKIPLLGIPVLSQIPPIILLDPTKPSSGIPVLISKPNSLSKDIIFVDVNNIPLNAIPLKVDNTNPSIQGFFTLDKQLLTIESPTKYLLSLSDEVQNPSTYDLILKQDPNNPTNYYPILKPLLSQDNTVNPGEIKLIPTNINDPDLENFITGLVDGLGNNLPLGSTILDCIFGLGYGPYNNIVGNYVLDTMTINKFINNLSEYLIEDLIIGYGARGAFNRFLNIDMGDLNTTLVTAGLQNLLTAPQFPITTCRFLAGGSASKYVFNLKGIVNNACNNCNNLNTTFILYYGTRCIWLTNDFFLCDDLFNWVFYKETNTNEWILDLDSSDEASLVQYKSNLGNNLWNGQTNLTLNFIQGTNICGLFAPTITISPNYTLTSSTILLPLQPVQNAIPCTSLVNGGKLQYSFTLINISNALCYDCENLNTTFILKQSQNCVWNSPNLALCYGNANWVLKKNDSDINWTLSLISNQNTLFQYISNLSSIGWDGQTTLEVFSDPDYSLCDNLPSVININ